MFLICIKLNYFYFSAVDLEVKSAEIWKHIQPFSGEKYDQVKSLGKY